MRITQDYKDPVVLFVDDDPAGGCIVQLPNGDIANTKELGETEEPYFDPETGREFFYPGWASW